MCTVFMLYIILLLFFLAFGPEFSVDVAVVFSFSIVPLLCGLV